jgi:hypothetical protein
MTLRAISWDFCARRQDMVDTLAPTHSGQWGPVVAVGNAFCAFSKERWARSVRPRLRQLPQTARFISTIGIELGHLVESAIRNLRRERRTETCASARWTVRDIQWEVAPRAPVQG